jgi:hypothetical protein
VEPFPVGTKKVEYIRQNNEDTAKDEKIDSIPVENDKGKYTLEIQSTDSQENNNETFKEKENETVAVSSNPYDIPDDF